MGVKNKTQNIDADLSQLREEEYRRPVLPVMMMPMRELAGSDPDQGGYRGRDRKEQEAVNDLSKQRGNLPGVLIREVV
jgi:hypothetical protein